MRPQYVNLQASESRVIPLDVNLESFFVSVRAVGATVEVTVDNVYEVAAPVWSPAPAPIDGITSLTRVVFAVRITAGLAVQATILQSEQLNRKWNTSLLAMLFPQSAPGVGPAGYALDYSDLTEEKLAWRRNQFAYTDELNNTYWSLQGSTVQAASVGPTGPAWRLVEDATTTAHQLVRVAPYIAGRVYTSSVYAKAGARNVIQLNYGGHINATFDLATGVVLTVQPPGAVWSNLSAGADPVVGFPGWYRVWVTRTSLTDLPASTLRVGILVGGNQNYLGDGTGDVLISGLQNEVGPLTPYQRLTDAYTEFLAAFPYHSLYRENTFATPAMALEDPIGGALDLRFGGLRSGNIATNGDFTADALWSKGAGWTIAGGRAVRASVPGGSILSQNGVLTAGKLYEVTFDCYNVTGVVASALRGGVTVTGPSAVMTNFTGKYSARMFAVAGTSSYDITVSSANATGEFDNFSITEVYGNHAIQATPGDRPAASARVNLIVASERFADAAWTKVAATVADGSDAGPDGMSLSTITGTAATVAYVQQTGLAVPLNTVVGVSTFIKAGSSTASNFRVYNSTIGTMIAGIIVNWAGGVPSLGSSIGTWATAPTLEATSQSGVYRLSGAINSGSFAAIAALFYPSALNTADTAKAGGVQVQLGPVGKYQRVNTATDYDYVGFPMGARGNGINTSMSIPGLDLSGSNKALLFFSVRKASDASYGTVFEHGIGGTDPLAFSLTAPRSAGVAAYGLDMRDGTNTVSVAPAGYAAPHTAVLSAALDYAGGTPAADMVFGVNDSDTPGVGTNVTSAGFGNYTGYLWKRGGTTLPMDGLIFRAGLRGGAIGANDRATAKQWANQPVKVLA